MNLEQLKENFYKLGEEEQWIWLFNTPHKDKFFLYLDNDNTSLHWLEDKESEHEMMFKADIGDRYGVLFLLRAIGIDARFV
jgi:hypothetical protein